MGTANVTKNASIAQSPSSPFAKKFPSTPLAFMKNCTTPLTPLTAETVNNQQNGSATANSETVTVTHYSEERGTMEKISVPSIFNADFKTETNEKNSTNPFLNMLPTTSSTTSVSSTNPFRSPAIDGDKSLSQGKHTNGASPTATTDCVSPAASANDNVNDVATPANTTKNPFTTAATDETDNLKTFNVVKPNTPSQFKIKNNNNNNNVNNQNNNSRVSDEKTRNEVGSSCIIKIIVIIIDSEKVMLKYTNTTL